MKQFYCSSASTLPMPRRLFLLKALKFLVQLVTCSGGLGIGLLGGLGGLVHLLISLMLEIFELAELLVFLLLLGSGGLLFRCFFSGGLLRSLVIRPTMQRFENGLSRRILSGIALQVGGNLAIGMGTSSGDLGRGLTNDVQEELFQITPRIVNGNLAWILNPMGGKEILEFGDGLGREARSNHLRLVLLAENVFELALSANRSAVEHP